MSLFTTFLDYQDTGPIDIFVDEELVAYRERTIGGELKVTNLPFLLRPLGGIAERLIYSNAENLLNEEAKVFGEFLKTRKPAG